MGWENGIVEHLKTRNKIKNMMKEAIRTKFNELHKAFTEDTDLKGYSIELLGSNEIEINLQKIIIEYDDVINQLENEKRIDLEIATQENINDIVEDIIETKIYHLF